MSHPETLGPQRPSPRPEESHAWEKGLSLSAAFFLLLYICYYFLSNFWGRWGSVTVDFGRELYIPWQILQGKILYRDLAHINGPLSQYFNALVFYFFGASISTLLTANITIAALTSICIWRVVSMLTDNLVASLSVVVFVSLSVFSHDYDAGIFSFIAPYSHEITHGLLLGFAGLVALSGYAKRSTARRGFSLGTIMGLALLTKPEIALGVNTSLGTGVWLSLRHNNRGRRENAASLAFIILGLLAPVTIAMTYLSLALSFDEALASITRMWRMSLDPHIRENEYYKKVLGTYYFVDSIKGIWHSLVIITVSFAFIIIGSQLGKVIHSCRGFICCIFVSAIAYFVADFSSNTYYYFNSILWLQAGPLLSFILLITLLARGIQQTGPGSQKIIVSVAFALFSTCLTLKVFFNAQFIHYGNFLLIPALILFCIATLYYIPNIFFKDAAIRRTAFTCGLIAISFLIYPRILMSINQLKIKQFPIYTHRGTIYWDNRSDSIQRILMFIKQNTKNGQSVAVFPEGEMLNFLSNTHNPIPYIHIIPPEWASFGDVAIVDALIKNHPDWIIVIKRDVETYGVGSFEEGYGSSIMAYIKSNYENTGFKADTNFAVSIYKWKHDTKELSAKPF